ncbi:MAG TPA: MupA/Atu3671 family FMN-dependent luciferase-like monooxygenase [Mycobacteriales bacterium]|nr:MupA/Atu3671 family FMN-dependent luciferase-like monooxygenase [Mycobacteriales bacterium]
MRFGLFFFGSHEIPADPGESPYAVLLEAARFADRNAFEFVSTPERHFTRFGGLFPNPALTSAAIAATTTRVQVRAGSLVPPLSDVVRLVEDWSMVDLISNGRVGLCFDTGREVDDATAPQDGYPGRRSPLLRQVDQIRALWRTRGATGPGRPGGPHAGSGPLPVWVTAHGHPQSFAGAGRVGVNVLTHLVNTDPQDLAEHVRDYRKGRTAAGLDPDAGVVTLMQHTYVSDDRADVRAATAELVSRSGIDPPFGRCAGPDGGVRTAPAGAHDPVVTPVLRGAPRRYAEEHALLGSVAGCADWVRRLAESGVDEIACVVDFVGDPDLFRRGLPGLAALRRACADPGGRGPARVGPDRYLGWG